MGLLDLFVSKNDSLMNIIIKNYYRGYQEIPYISKGRRKEWLERARLFPHQTTIPKSMMTRFEDGLLPGHVYMLYWLGRYTNKKVPIYFECQYGVDFEREKAFLIDLGFLDLANKPTAKGEETIKKHYEVVEKHTQKYPSAEEQTLMQKENLKRNGFKEYTIIPCNDACKVCKAFSRKHFLVSKMEIGKNAPPFHDGCRCSIAAYEDSAEYEAWLNHLANGGTTKQWKRTKKKG
jgi:SPP1 gp7 family putative phage head morphogenesis protein